jgi:putative membrane protein
MKIKNIDKFNPAFRWGLVATGLLLGAVTVPADDSKEDKDNQSTAESRPGKADLGARLQECAKMNMGTIRFAQLATQKAQNPELKSFAQTLEQDHKQAQLELQTIAAKHNVTLPTTLDAKCEEEISRLQAKSGEEFDREFAKGAVEGHAVAVAHLQQAQVKVQNPELQQHFSKILSKVREHQRQGRQVAMAVGVDQTTISSLERKAQEGVGSPGANTQGTESQNSQSKDSKKQVD